MIEHENELKKALAENGTYDPVKADNLTAHAVSAFQAQLKKSERLLMISLLACAAVMVVAWSNLWLASDPKMMILFGFLLYVALETTVLMKLWYWVISTRIILQKEIRLWQPPTAASGPAAAMPREAESLGFGPKQGIFGIERGLSRRERIAWRAAILIVVIAALYPLHRFVIEHDTTTTMDRYVSLKPSGASSIVEDFNDLNLTLGSMLSFAFVTDNVKATFRWLDEHGHEMPFRVYTKDGKRYYTVCLSKPVLPREWFHYTRITENPSSATKERDRWVYEGQYVNGYPNNRYRVTIELPRGATLISREPEPVQLWSDLETIHMVVVATRKAMEPFRYKVQYQLADKEGSEKPRQ
jgi:hypothetical protein